MAVCGILLGSTVYGYRYTIVTAVYIYTLSLVYYFEQSRLREIHEYIDTSYYYRQQLASVLVLFLLICICLLRCSSRSEFVDIFEDTFFKHGKYEFQCFVRTLFSQLRINTLCVVKLLLIPWITHLRCGH